LTTIASKSKWTPILPTGKLVDFRYIAEYHKALLIMLNSLKQEYEDAGGGAPPRLLLE
jgi:hypothetical protein